MKILIVAATWPEIALIAKHFNLPEKDFVSSPTFDLLVTGVGMTATAFALGQHLSGKYGLILNLGIAGSFNPDIALGTVLNIVNDEFYELGAEDRDTFLSIEELGFGKSRYQAHHHLLNDDVSNLQKVSGITVNRVHGQAQSIAKVMKTNPASTESMEGAAVLYAAEKTGIPCLQVRSISNYVRPRNREEWKIGLAVKNLNEWAIGFLTNA
jgi:futalosine hydrolase